MSKKLESTLFNMKFTAKSLVRQSKKCEKEKKKWEKKLQEAIKKSDRERAKIYAENVIREKNQAIQYLRLSSRLEAVAGRVESALRTHSLSKQMGTIVSGMDKVLTSMDTASISKIMDKFQSQFEDIDVKSAYMEEAMGDTTATSAPIDEINDIIAKTAEANSLELSEAFHDVRLPTRDPASTAAEAGPSAVLAGPPVPGSEDDGAAGGGGGSGPPAGGGGGSGGGSSIADLEARLAALRS